MAVLKVENLSVAYESKNVLKNVHVTFDKNEITAIIGPSGCGKSTLLFSLNTLICENKDASISGEMYFKGEKIDFKDTRKIREKIGMVFQKPSPFPLSIVKNMEFPLKYYGIRKDERDQTIKEKLEIVGLYEEVKDEMKKSALKLSGGQQQRLCIARALTIEPEVLLLDEPCSALDVKNTEIIEKLLVDLKKEYTIIIVTHNLNQAKRIADKVVFMFEGEVIEEGTPEEIFENPKDERTKDILFID